MCLGIPGRIIAPVDGYAGQLALVDVNGTKDHVNLGMLDEPLPEPGEWVLIHMGFAMERLDEAGATRAMQGLELMGRGKDTPP